MADEPIYCWDYYVKRDGDGKILEGSRFQLEGYDPTPIRDDSAEWLAFAAEQGKALAPPATKPA